MKRLLILVFSPLITLASIGQPIETIVVKPICHIRITPMKGNMLKGMLLLTQDSVVIIYPGKRKEWNRNKNYSVAVYSYSKIKKIVIKKNGRVTKGVAIGTVVGALPFLAGLNMIEIDALVRMSAITTSAGVIAGALLGFTAQRRFFINATESAFYQFQKQVQ